MLEKLNETDDIKQRLASKLDDVSKEIEEAKVQKADLERSLEQKKQPLDLASRRLSLRLRRPCRERVKDEAHQALLVELQHIAAVTNALKAKIAQADDTIRHLEQQREILKSNMEDKQKSWNVRPFLNDDSRNVKTGG